MNFWDLNLNPITMLSVNDNMGYNASYYQKHKGDIKEKKRIRDANKKAKQ